MVDYFRKLPRQKWLVWIAILADTGATVLVTLNALRLLRYDPGGGAR